MGKLLAVGLQGEQLGETENPNKYVQRQLKIWKQETEGNPERDSLMATLFINAVIDAMPQAIKSRLEDVVGLNSKTHMTMCLMQWSNTEIMNRNSRAKRKRYRGN